jgi:outer membrane protein assembly factor BamB
MCLEYETHEQTGEVESCFDVMHDSLEGAEMRRRVAAAPRCSLGRASRLLLAVVVGICTLSSCSSGRGSTQPVPERTDLSRVTAYDAVSGRQRWATSVGLTERFATYASGGVVYVTGTTACNARATATLIALDAHNGQEKWRIQTDAAGESLDPRAGGVIPPRSDSAVVVVAGGAPSSIRGLDASTGKERWHLSLAQFGLPVLATDDVVVIWVGNPYKPDQPATSVVTAYDRSTGEPLWTTTVPGFSFGLSGGALIASDADPAKPHPRGTQEVIHTQGFDLATGRQVWTTTRPAPQLLLYASRKPGPPAASPGVTLNGSDTVGFDTTTGIERWTVKSSLNDGTEALLLTDDSVYAAGPPLPGITPSTTATTGTVTDAFDAITLTALDIDTGRPRWGARLDFLNRRPSLIANDKVVGASALAVQATEPSGIELFNHDGHKLWDRNPAPGLVTAAIDRNNVYLGQTAVPGTCNGGGNSSPTSVVTP